MEWGRWYHQYGWKKFTRIVPVIEQQDYIERVSVMETNGAEVIFEGHDYSPHFYLDHYLSLGHMCSDRTKVKSIVRAHYLAMQQYTIPCFHPGIASHPEVYQKILDGIPPTDREIKPWLVCKTNHQTTKYPIILHETALGGSINYEFFKHIPKELVGNISYGPESYIHNNKDIGIPVGPHTVLDVFELINNCDLFVGNQSLPLALAAGLGKNRIVSEHPMFMNCTFHQENELGTYDTPAEELLAFVKRYVSF